MTTVDGILGGLEPDEPVAVVRDGHDTVVALGPAEVVSANGEEALAVLGTLGPGWWAGFLSYDLGRAVERVPTLARADPGIPDLLLARFATRFRVAPDGAVRVEGEPRVLPDNGLRINTMSGGRTWRSSVDRRSWERAVRTILEHLRAGDCYQVNLARRLESEGAPDAVSLFRRLLAQHAAPHAALLRMADVSVVSASPERFLRVEGRSVETRPIKGTGTDAADLAQSPKDRAENVMIVDLARNDLGRVCEYESVHVPGLCEVEEHPGLVHLVSTVRGTLRPEVHMGDVVRATFPPASVTGCPKPRVLEIIERLEPVRRGVYCGAIGFIDTELDIADLNVAIRTFTLGGDGMSFGVGAGIVADSDPGAEWEETELKARRLLALASSAL